ncbi:MAG: MbcA/ParS/Xre antitoxin family protein [Halopseudomonas aestusnigri]
MLEKQKMILNLFGKWELTEQEAANLLDLPLERYYEFHLGEFENLNSELGNKVDELLRIHKALRTLFDDPERGYLWIRRPNTVFKGKIALEIMILNLKRVRIYLEAEVNG